jgi:transposase-like protein
MPSRKTKDFYTEEEIVKEVCFRCKKKAHTQWHICADANVPRPLCLACDVQLNLLVLEWMGDPKKDLKIKRYKKDMLRRYGNDFIESIKDSQ